MAKVKKYSDWFLYGRTLYKQPLSIMYSLSCITSITHPVEIGLLRVGPTTFYFTTPIEATAKQRYALWFSHSADEHGFHDFPDIPYEDDLFAWAVRGVRAIKGDIPMGIVAFGGEMHPIIPSKLLAVGEPPLDQPPAIAPVWCPVANMVAERHAGPGGREVWRGSKHFQSGAKLYYQSGFGGMGGESVTVVGRHRGSHRYVTMVVRSAWLEHWRADLVYSPHVIRQLWPYWYSTSEAKQRAETLAESMNRYHAAAETAKQSEILPDVDDQ